MNKAFRGLFRIKSLKDRYLSLSLVTALSLISFCADAQYDSTKNLQDVQAYGYSWKNGKFKNSLIIANDTPRLAVRDSGAIAYKDGGLWTYNGHYWSPVFDSTNLVNSDADKLNIIDTIGQWQPQHNTLDTLDIEILQDTLLHFHHLYSNGSTRDDTIPFINSKNFDTHLAASIDTTRDTIVVKVFTIDGDTILTVHHDLTSGKDTLIWRMDSVSLVHGGYLTKTQYAALLAAAGGGSVTSFSKTDGYGIISSVANSTTTPNHTIRVDTAAIATIPRLLNDSAALKAAIDLKLNISDTTNKWVQDARSNAGGDSLIVIKNAVRSAYKYPAGNAGTVTTVTGSAPIVITSTPTTTPNVTITQATTSTNGYLSSTDWNTFNNKQATISVTAPVTLSGATVGVDTTNGNTHLATQGDITNDRVNPIAGTNVTITGSYPNLTFNASGAAQTTADSTLTATAGQTAFTFASVPASSSDYMVFVNEQKWIYTTGYTTSGNVITMTTPLAVGDKVNYVRIK